MRIVKDKNARSSKLGTLGNAEKCTQRLQKLYLTQHLGQRHTNPIDPIFCRVAQGAKPTVECIFILNCAHINRT